MTSKADLQWLSSAIAGEIDQMTAALAHAEGTLGLPSEFAGGFGDDVEMPTLDLPGQFPEAPAGSDAGQEWPDLATGVLGDSGMLPAADFAPPPGADLRGMPARLPPDEDYPVNEPPPAFEPPPAQGGPQFSQWTERDGSVVFEDGPPLEASQLPERPQPTPWPDRMADEPGDDVLGGVVGDLFGQLQQIFDAITNQGGRGQQRGGGGLNLPTGAAQLPWSGMGASPTPEDLEGYSAASPSIVDATSLSGIRGAGGHGAGSRLKAPLIDLTEPNKRLSSHE